MIRQGHTYIITNILNGKKYVGWTTKPQARWRDHLNIARFGGGYDIHAALRRYGPEMFEFEVVFSGSISAAKKREVALIAEFDSYNKGYNRTLGGEGVLGLKIAPSPHSDETREKIRQRLLASWKLRKSRSLPGERLRKPHSIETRRKISDAIRESRKRNPTPRIRHYSKKIRRKLAGLCSERMRALWKNPQYRKTLLKIRSRKKVK